MLVVRDTPPLDRLLFSQAEKREAAEVMRARVETLGRLREEAAAAAADRRRERAEAEAAAAAAARAKSDAEALELAARFDAAQGEGHSCLPRIGHGLFGDTAPLPMSPFPSLL
jgi:hypothetical protein